MIEQESFSNQSSLSASSHDLQFSWVADDDRVTPVRSASRSNSSEQKSFDNKAAIMTVLSSTVNDFIQDQLSKLPDVNYIFTEQHGDVFYVRVIIQDSDDASVDRVIEQQRKIMREFGDFAFDFSIMFQTGRDVSELISPAKPLYKRA